MSTTRSRAIDADLFDWPAAEPALKASLCVECGRHAFPRMSSCRSCGGTAVETVRLPRRGTLWTWTVQRFMPKAPYRSLETEATFAPFGLGYVELPGTLRIETRLTESDPARLRIGSPVELVIYPQFVDEDGTEVMGYAFRPLGGEAAP
ncbi:MAG TPA: OB-fold domain-containing protein [Steroidobacteraceae bacterium]|nr:OB-fold domain-containing protein [Steroidobacteraceae bacterium]